MTEQVLEVSFPRKRESTGGHGVEFLYATAGAGSLTVARFHGKPLSRGWEGVFPPSSVKCLAFD